MRLTQLACCIVLTFPLSAHCAPAHVHGVARIDLAVDGDQLTLSLEMPLDNLVGFEHAPVVDVGEGFVGKLAQQRTGAVDHPCQARIGRAQQRRRGGEEECRREHCRQDGVVGHLGTRENLVREHVAGAFGNDWAIMRRYVHEREHP